MKLFLIGGTGNIGSNILTEALSRIHDVTALTRDPTKLEAKPNLQVVKGDVLDSNALAGQIKGHDAVIVSYNPGWQDPEIGPKTTQAAESILAALRKAGIKRVFWVGGAGSLEVKPGVKLLETMELPPGIKSAIVALAGVLDTLRTIDDLDWTFFSPAGEIGPGERTGKFRLGTDQLVVGADGKSRISRADYAIAVIDELENPKHIKKRFTIGY